MFVRVVEGRCKDPEALRREWELWAREVAPAGVGWLGSTAGVSADGLFVVVTRFESEEAAHITSDRAEHGEWSRLLAAHLTDRPVVRDCPEVRAFLRGSWDDAALVRIEQGRARAIDRLISNFEARGALERSSLVAGILAWGADWYVTEALYFRGEADTAAEPSARDRSVDRLREDAALLVDVSAGFDLPGPWSAAPPAR